MHNRCFTLKRDAVDEIFKPSARWAPSMRNAHGLYAQPFELNAQWIGAIIEPHRHETCAESLINFPGFLNFLNRLWRSNNKRSRISLMIKNHIFCIEMITMRMTNQNCVDIIIGGFTGDHIGFHGLGHEVIIIVAITIKRIEQDFRITALDHDTRIPDMMCGHDRFRARYSRFGFSFCCSASFRCITGGKRG